MRWAKHEPPAITPYREDAPERPVIKVPAGKQSSGTTWLYGAGIVACGVAMVTYAFDQIDHARAWDSSTLA
jgi:hypothetical protein